MGSRLCFFFWWKGGLGGVWGFMVFGVAWFGSSSSDSNHDNIGAVRFAGAKIKGVHSRGVRGLSNARCVFLGYTGCIGGQGL